MFVLCAASKDKNAKCRTNKTKKKARMKCRVKENTKKSPGGGEIFHTCPERPRRGADH